MKRCPQCEFIYEEDQSLCDMDGVLLVFDARTLPNMSALAPVDVPVAPRAHWRHRTFPAMAALILASVLSLVYFVSTQRTAPVSTPMPFSGAATTTAPAAPALDSTAPPLSGTNQAPPPAPEANAAAVASKEEPRPAKDETKSESVRSNSKPASTSSSPPAAKKVSVTTTTQRQPEEPKKDDSKVGSILKKTGRLLKKPFKL